MLIEPRDPEYGGMMSQSEAAQARSNLYALLAAVFRSEPTADLLREVMASDIKAAVEAVGVSLNEDSEAQSEEDTVEALALEFTRLFIGPGVHVPPYAAVHLGDEWASLWGPETVWVKDFIESAGFSYRTGYHDLPDHVSVELEFMKELTAREAVALERSDVTEVERVRSIQNVFVNEHLSRWIPVFCDRVASRAERQFYRGIAGLTKDFIEFEKEGLNTERESRTEKGRMQ